MNKIKNVFKSVYKGLFKPENKLSLIPNWLSFSRAISGALIPTIIYTGASAPLLIGVLSFTALSDVLDGFTARKFVKEETKEGALLDAVSDKIFSILLLLGLIPLNPIFGINLILEGAISVVNAKVLSMGGKPKSNILGKIKIWPLSISIVLGYASLALKGGIFGISSGAILSASALLSIVSVMLEIENVKDYSEGLIKENNLTEVIKETGGKTKEKKKDKKKDKKENLNSLSLDKNKNIPIMVFEKEKEFESEEKHKILKK